MKRLGSYRQFSREQGNGEKLQKVYMRQRVQVSQVTMNVVFVDTLYLTYRTVWSTRYINFAITAAQRWKEKRNERRKKYKSVGRRTT